MTHIETESHSGHAGNRSYSSLSMTTHPHHQKGSSLSSRPLPLLIGGLLILGSSAMGCGSDGDGDADGGGADIVVLDQNNYTGVATLTIPVVETAPGTNIEFCIDSLVANLQCHALDPLVDIANVSFLKIQGMSKEEITAKLEADTFATSDVKTYFDHAMDGVSSCVNLQDFASFGDPPPLVDPPVDYIEDPTMEYLVLFSDRTTPGVGAQSMMFLEPTPGSAVTTAPAQSGCDLLDFVVDLESSTPLEVKNDGPWMVDWSDLTMDGQGNPVKFNKVDRLLVGFYEGMTLADLEAQVFDLESLPKDLYELSLTGQREANLANAVHTQSGANFTGFAQATEGVWILGLLCGGCQTPAPIVLSTLTPIP